MAHDVFTLLWLLGIFAPLGGALYEQEWTKHGMWNLGRRSFHEIIHFSCTLPTPVPVDHFLVTIKFNSTLPVTFTGVWSLDLYSKNQDGTLTTFHNLQTMYPPRIVLHFHVKKVRIVDLTATCLFTILNKPSSTTEAPTTMQTPIPFFFPGLILPKDMPRPRPGLLPSPSSDPAVCLEVQLVFPEERAQLIVDLPIPYADTFSTSSTASTTGTTGTTGTPAPFMPRFPGQNTTDSTAPPRLRPLRPRLPPSMRFKRALPQTFPETLPALVKMDYREAMEMSMMFYMAQRSGNFENPPLGSPYQWARPSGTYHSFVGQTDLTGGWYNGNDNIKVTLTMASATTVLAWGYNTWSDAYSGNGLDETFKEMIKWPLDYLLKVWDKYEPKLFVQVGGTFSGRPLWNRADDYAYTELWNKGYQLILHSGTMFGASDAAAEVASAMALASLIQFDDESFSTRLLDTAKELYTYADTYRGKYSDLLWFQHVDEYPFFESSGYEDELCFAAAVLYHVTGRSSYRADAVSLFSGFAGNGTPEFFSWDDKRVACAVMLYKITGDEQYRTYVRKFRDFWMSPFIKSTPDGLAWVSGEGTLRYTANTIFILLQSIEAGIFEESDDIYTWASEQMAYMLGVNSMKRSYLIGYGANFPRNPFHKNSACPHPAKTCGWGFYNSDLDNTNVLVGALVGGPDLNDYHEDSRQNTIGNSVAIDYNAGFQSALAGLQSRKDALLKACDEQRQDGMIGGFGTPDSMSSTYSSSSLSTTAKTMVYTTPKPTPVPEIPEVFDYADSLRKSILFYAAQRSGAEPENNPITWRQWDANDTEINGGWFDDGSNVKTTKVMASAVTLIGWGAIKFKGGYEAAGALSDLYDSLKWPLDYFIKIWQAENEILRRKVGWEVKERAYWTPQSIDDRTEVFSATFNDGQGPEVAADVATALAVGSVLFKDEDAQYSETLLTKAKQVYTLAKKLDVPFKDTSSVYYSDPGDDFGDEMCVAAWWLYKASQDSMYYNDGMTYMSRKSNNFALDWKDKDALCHMLVYEYTGSFKTSSLIIQGLQYLTEDTTFTPQGLAWHDNEPLKFAANGAFIQVLAESYGVLSSRSRDFYKKQIDYILGNNNNAYSYQIGYGNRYPRRPHHRASSCPDYMQPCDWSIYNSPWKNPHELIGALVSGPDVNDVYEDVRSNYTVNRVSVEHNAGFQSVLAYLVEHHSQTTTTTTTRKATTAKVTTTTTTPTSRPKTTAKQTSKKDTTTKEPIAIPKTKAPKTSASKTTKLDSEDGGTREAAPTQNPGIPGPFSTDKQNEIAAATSITATLNTVLCLTFIHFVYLCL